MEYKSNSSVLPKMDILGRIVQEASEQAMNYWSELERTNKTGIIDPRKNYTKAVSQEIVARYVIGIVELLVFIIGTPANCLVLYLTYRIFRRRERYQREDGHFQHGLWFVLTMTSFDLLFCLIHAPMMFTMYLLVDYLPQTTFSCAVMQFATFSSTMGSSLSLLALNVEKFIRLYKPLHYRTLITKRRTVTASVFIWIISISWSIFLLLGPWMERKRSLPGQCNLSIKRSWIYALFASMFFILPTVISLAISVFTLIAALRIRRNRRYPVLKEIVVLGREEQRSLRQVSFPHTDSTSTLRSHDKVNGKQCRNGTPLMRLVAFVFTTTVWTSLTTLPYRIGYLCVATNPQLARLPVLRVCLFYLLAITVLNAAGNPFITIATKRQYSSCARRLFAARRLSESCNANSAKDTETSVKGNTPGANTRDRRKVQQVGASGF